MLVTVVLYMLRIGHKMIKTAEERITQLELDCFNKTIFWAIGC